MWPLQPRNGNRVEKQGSKVAQNDQERKNSSCRSCANQRGVEKKFQFLMSHTVNRQYTSINSSANACIKGGSLHSITTGLEINLACGVWKLSQTVQAPLKHLPNTSNLFIPGLYCCQCPGLRLPRFPTVCSLSRSKFPEVGRRGSPCPCKRSVPLSSSFRGSESEVRNIKKWLTCMFTEHLLEADKSMCQQGKRRAGLAWQAPGSVQTAFAAMLTCC